MLLSPEGFPSLRVTSQAPTPAGLGRDITQLQGEGGKRMAAADYLRGHSVQVGV